MKCLPAIAVTMILTWPCAAQAASEKLLPGFHRSPWFGEQILEEWVDKDVRILINAPGRVDAERPTRLIIFATPNGNSIEQTLGCATAAGGDWHYDIQHIAAQVRKLRELFPNENLVLACLEAEGLSWPAWRKKHADAATQVRRIVDGLRAKVPGPAAKVTLTGHSGGGSFVFAFIDSADAIPGFVDRIAFLDSNYSYSDTSHHGDKLLAWLHGESSRRLVSIAYDDRQITVNGKLVVGPDGGTFRATQRMLARFGRDLEFTESRDGDFVIRTGLDGRAKFWTHSNPANKILHTALVGDMNGLIQAQTEGGPSDWGKFDGPRAYTKWVQPAPAIPPRKDDAPGGTAFMKSIASLSRDGREQAITTQFLAGNIPEFLRKYCSITIHGQDGAGKEHTAIIDVMPDYLAVGSDRDFVRVPMSPLAAQCIADAYGCALPTRKIVDEIYRAAAVKLEPRPLIEKREAVETFMQHNDIIEKQRAGKPLGELIAGIKKDVVVTNRLAEKPDRVAIFGWHKLDGVPIQPLTIVHVNWYVDYSHGIRLMRRTVMVDGKPRDVRYVLQSPDLCNLISDEGPLLRPSY